jgi:hypothetical protein
MKTLGGLLNTKYSELTIKWKHKIRFEHPSIPDVLLPTFPKSAHSRSSKRPHHLWSVLFLLASPLGLLQFGI